MRRLIWGFVVLELMFGSSLLAKERYKVHIIQPKTHEKSWGSVGLMVGGFVFDIIANAIANTQSVQNIANDIEEYIYHHGLDEEQIVDHFGDKIKLSIIEQFYTDQYTYRTDQEIPIKIRLKQNAYIYLIDLNSKRACIIFPYSREMTNYFVADKNQDLLPEDLNFQANAEGREQLYLVSSTRKLNLYKKFDYKQCTTSQSQGMQIISRLRRNKLVDIAEKTLTIDNP